MRPPFAPGNPGGPGRPAGVRNKLSKAFLEDLLVEWREHGAQAIKLMRIESPGNFVRVVASTLPKELLFEGSTTAALSDDELDALIDQLKRQMLTVSENRPLMIETKIAEPADER